MPRPERSTGSRFAGYALSDLFDTDPARCRKAETARVLWGAMTLMPSSIALLFPGQGSHAEGMDEPYRGHPLMERGLELLGYNPFENLAEGTRYQQPALFLCSVAAWDAWRAEPPEDDAGEAIAAAGHSLGEYAALVAAGALEFDDAVKLVDERADAMAVAGEQRSGGMIAFLGGESRDVRALADRLGLVIANDNAPGQLVLSGSVDALEQAEEVARDETGARARRLDVTGAFHSPLMEPAADRLRAALENTPVHPMQIPVYSNGTAAPFADVRAELAENLLRPVRWRETLLALRTAGAERFVELGPGAVLTGLVKRTLAAA
jgi:[acyl-carrier-protein] S-malonyltransferase